MQLFLPWHRAYLYTWEMAMRDRVPGVTLPWWDWTLGPPRQSGLPAIFTDRNGNGNVPSDLLDVVLAPFNMKVSDALSVNALGYDYGAAQTVVPIGGTG
jgi:tyrosinase